MNVYEAAKKRIQFLFDEFEQIIVAFSGGKDSGVCLNLTLEVGKAIGQLSKVKVFHLDYEAQYQETTDYVTRTMHSLPREVTPLWVCLPVKVGCATSMFQTYWQPWLNAERDIWCREIPEGCINEDNFPFDFDYDIDDYDFNDKFGRALSKKCKTAIIIGIRTQESLHRYKAVNKATDKNEYKSVRWTTVDSGMLVKAYPIYDWSAEDIWTANCRFEWDYNKLYDLFYQAGVPLHEMRVASPFISQGQDSLKLYRVLDPNNWAKLIGRVNGVNFTSIYGGTSAMGWRSIEKPEHFTWKEFMDFLLSTLPEDTRKRYLDKLNTSIEYWAEKGGAIPAEAIKAVEGIPHERLGPPMSKRIYKNPHEVIRFERYLDDIDAPQPLLFPTYKRMCIAIMKNDIACKTLGFAMTKKDLEKRKEAIERYGSIL